MIRVNLLADELHRTRVRSRGRRRQRLFLACGAVLLLAILAVGARVRALQRQHARLAAESAVAERELAALAPELERVRALEAVRRRLAERVGWLEARQRQQDRPGRMLDDIGRSLPDSVWLTEVRQAPAVVVVRGRAADLTAVSDFVAGLERSASFAPPVEVVDSEVDGRGRAADPVRFELQAALRDPGLDAGEPEPR